MDDISRKREILERCPPGHAGRYVALYNLALGLYQRYEKEHNIDELNEAITLHRDALELRPAENEKGNRSRSLNELAVCLYRRYEKLGAVDDLEETIALGREALALRPPGHPSRYTSLHNLGSSLWTRFKKQAEVCDLEEAIPLFRAALQLRPPGHQWRSSTLHYLILCLSSRYESRGLVEDLEELVTLRRAMLDLCPRGHSDHVAFLHNLACDLRRRYAKTAAISDVEESIELHRAALELRPPGHRDRSSTLDELTLCLSTTYDKLGIVADLEEAIEFGRETLKLLPRGYGESLHNLACNLRKRFVNQTAMQDLEEAIELLHAALELRPIGHPGRSSSLCELAFWLSHRHDEHGAAVALEEAVTLGREALKLCPQGHSNRASSLHNLAQCLADRYREKLAAADLDEAISLEQEALHLFVRGVPDYHLSRRCLAACLQMKFNSRVAMKTSGAASVNSPNVKEVIRNVAFEILKTMPTRLLHTPTGVLCSRDEQISHFMDSQQCKELESLCTTCDRHQQRELIHADISRHFQYVTLSHRWGEGEPSLHDVEDHTIYDMPIEGGFGKVQAFCRVALELDYLWGWSDTCCIDKHSSAEVQETIGSMFAWYRQSALTIVYLSDVPDTGSIGSSEWFRRGWTLQELLAPRTILFYTQNWSLYKNLASPNHKTDTAVLEELERETRIERRFLTGFSPGMDDARSRLQWASLRRTTRPEDIAYSLFGIFNVHLPVMYGESAENALGRLLAEIVSQSGDISVLDWVGEPSPFHSCFPARVASYQILRLPTSQPNAEELCSAINQQPTSFEVLRELRDSLATSYLPHFLGRSLLPSSIANRVLPVHARTPASYASSEVYGFNSLARVPLPRLFNRLLTLPCIAYHVTSVQLKGADPSTPNYMYDIVASGLVPLEITLSTKLEDLTRPQAVLHLVRPWHSKLLGPSANLDAVTDWQILSALGTPFNALLLTELPHNEHKRIVSSTLITAQPMNEASILNSKIRIFNVV
ncbi:hypothetical protein EDD15DRAFT_1357945 [Pisolithus albus]|nr:hypothetical protein EDD15DRAFT_1357945 [Pisolithus albus]